jgi:hypothetical protein
LRAEEEDLKTQVQLQKDIEAELRDREARLRQEMQEQEVVLADARERALAVQKELAAIHGMIAQFTGIAAIAASEMAALRTTVAELLPKLGMTGKLILVSESDNRAAPSSVLGEIDGESKNGEPTSEKVLAHDKDAISTLTGMDFLKTAFGISSHLSLPASPASDHFATKPAEANENEQALDTLNPLDEAHASPINPTAGSENINPQNPVGRAASPRIFTYPKPPKKWEDIKSFSHLVRLAAYNHWLRESQDERINPLTYSGFQMFLQGRLHRKVGELYRKPRITDSISRSRKLSVFFDKGTVYDKGEPTQYAHDIMRVLEIPEDVMSYSHKEGLVIDNERVRSLFPYPLSSLKRTSKVSLFSQKEAEENSGVVTSPVPSASSVGEIILPLPGGLDIPSENLADGERDVPADVEAGAPTDADVETVEKKDDGSEDTLVIIPPDPFLPLAEKSILPPADGVDASSEHAVEDEMVLPAQVVVEEEAHTDRGRVIEATYHVELAEGAAAAFETLAMLAATRVTHIPAPSPPKLGVSRDVLEEKGLLDPIEGEPGIPFGVLLQYAAFSLWEKGTKAPSENPTTASGFQNFMYETFATKRGRGTKQWDEVKDRPLCMRKAHRMESFLGNRDIFEEVGEGQFRLMEETKELMAILGIPEDIVSVSTDGTPIVNAEKLEALFPASFVARFEKSARTLAPRAADPHQPPDVKNDWQHVAAEIVKGLLAEGKQIITSPVFSADFEFGPLRKIETWHRIIRGDRTLSADIYKAALTELCDRYICKNAPEHSPKRALYEKAQEWIAQYAPH